MLNKLPPNVKLTIVSDSGHCGGLIENTKEKIGDSYQSSREGYGNDRDGSAFTKNTDSDGSYGGDDVEIKNKPFPLNILLELLKQKLGKDDVQVGNIRTTLFDLFGKDSSSTMEKFMRSLMEGDNNEQGGGEFMGLVGSLATQIVKQIAEDESSDNNSYAKQDGSGDNNSYDRSPMGGDNNEQGVGGFVRLVGFLGTQIVKQMVEGGSSDDNSYAKQDGSGDNNSDDRSPMGGDNNEQGGGGFVGW